MFRENDYIYIHIQTKVDRETRKQINKDIHM